MSEKQKTKVGSKASGFSEQKIVKRKNETLRGFFERVASKIRQFDNDKLVELIHTHLPEVDISEKGRSVKNPYSGRQNELNGIQYGLYDYIINYASKYSSPTVKQEALALQVEIANTTPFSERYFELQRQHAEILEKWNGARWLFRILWPYVYKDQID